jgi:acyl carrier protein
VNYMDVSIDVREKIKNIIIQTLELDISPSSINDGDIIFNGGGVEFDSFAALQIILGIEEEFNLFFDDEQLSEEMFYSVGQLCDFVERLLDEAKQAAR